MGIWREVLRVDGSMSATCRISRPPHNLSRKIVTLCSDTALNTLQYEYWHAFNRTSSGHRHAFIHTLSNHRHTCTSSIHRHTFNRTSSVHGYTINLTAVVHRYTFTLTSRPPRGELAARGGVRRRRGCLPPGEVHQGAPHPRPSHMHVPVGRAQRPGRGESFRENGN